MPAIKTTSTLLFILFHAYAIIGMELYDTKTQVYNYGSKYDTGVASFDSYWQALLQLFLLITENGWSNKIFDLQYKFDQLDNPTFFINSFFG